MDINKSLIKKAWGEEHLLYRNNKIAIWLLKIKYNHKTSLHAHIHKETGLIVIDGLARVSFLNNSITLKGLDKVMIFKGRFHRTTALSKKGAVLLEVESPEDKFDLLRLSDDYGRENKGYETQENYLPLTDELVIPEGATGEWSLYNTNIKIYHPENKKDLMGKDFETVIVFLDGGITTEKGLLSQAGDVVASHNLDVLLEKFDLAPKTLVMEITK